MEFLRTRKFPLTPISPQPKVLYHNRIVLSKSLTYNAKGNNNVVISKKIAHKFALNVLLVKSPCSFGMVIGDTANHPSPLRNPDRKTKFSPKYRLAKPILGKILANLTKLAIPPLSVAFYRSNGVVATDSDDERGYLLTSRLAGTA